MPTVLMAGGGTGGHVFPAVAIARELAETVPGCEVLFVGTARGLESRIVPAEGFRLLTIRSAGITGKRIMSRLKGMALLPVSLAQSWGMLSRARPVLVVGVGGYASGPVLAAAVLRRVPTLIHEQNYVPGATNLWLAPYVTQVAVTFPETIARLKGRGVVTGNPVRREFGRIPPLPEGARPGGHGVLVFGGSQGARAINHAVREALPALAVLKGKVRFTHQTGETDLEVTRSAYRDSGLEADVRPFIREMAQALEAADLVVSRSGATTVAELTAAGRPAVLIPFAAATHDHQTFNARKLADAGAAVLLPEKELTGERLAREVLDLIETPERLARMGRAARELGRPDAASRIAALCSELIAGRARGRAA